jgi:hypothetical protein
MIHNGHFRCGLTPKRLSATSHNVPRGVLLRAGDDNVSTVWVSSTPGDLPTSLAPGEDVLIHADPKDIFLTSDVDTNVAFLFEDRQ